jgi:hypothetical protein
MGLIIPRTQAVRNTDSSSCSILACSDPVHWEFLVLKLTTSLTHANTYVYCTTRTKFYLVSTESRPSRMFSFPCHTRGQPISKASEASLRNSWFLFYFSSTTIPILVSVFIAFTYSQVTSQRLLSDDHNTPLLSLAVQCTYLVLIKTHFFFSQ